MPRDNSLPAHPFYAIGPWEEFGKQQLHRTETLKLIKDVTHNATFTIMCNAR